jgi:nucleoside-diphosphate-sugar epimerase
VLDSFLFGQTPLLEWVHDESLRIVRGDARDADLLRELASGADTVIPLACLTGAPLCDRGQEGIHCDEQTPLRPVSLYGRLKVEAEQRILDRGHGITFRLATAFGISPRMRLDLLVNDFTWRAVHDRFIVLFEAHNKRNFIHVRDIARAFLHGLAHYDTMSGEPFNVGLDDANLSKIELCEVIRREVPGFVWSEAPVGEDPDKRNYIVSNAKIGRAGFKPQVGLQQGIAELVRGYPVLGRSPFSNV